MSSCSNQAPQGQATIPMTAAMQNKVLTQNLKDVRHKLFVMSGKGGVGKSLVTASLACAMKGMGKRVGVLDADITGPSIPQAFGVHTKAEGSELGIYPANSKGGVEIMSLNLLTEHETDPVVWRGPSSLGS